MKKIISALLAITLLAGMGSAMAIERGASRAVIGADLSTEQILAVYRTFGIERGDVPELFVTNAEERRYLEGLVAPAIIGTRSISCVFIEVLGPGEGLDVSVSNIDWVTREMYINALVTVGITDARVIITSPIPGISGTAALTGIFKAYEDITGRPIDEAAKIAGTTELVITAELADQIGEIDAVTIVNELKFILDQTVNMTDDELRLEIRQLANEHNVSLTDTQINALVRLVRSFENLGPEELRQRVEGLQNTLQTLVRAQSVASTVVEGVRQFFETVGRFLSDIFSR